jgi:hypothetical protein
MSCVKTSSVVFPVKTNLCSTLLLARVQSFLRGAIPSSSAVPALKTPGYRRRSLRDLLVSPISYRSRPYRRAMKFGMRMRSPCGPSF